MLASVRMSAWMPAPPLGSFAANILGNLGPLGMATLAELCRHFDPKKIMNPGKLLQDGGPWAA